MGCEISNKSPGYLRHQGSPAGLQCHIQPTPLGVAAITAIARPVSQPPNADLQGRRRETPRTQHTRASICNPSQTSRYGEIPFLSSSTISAASSVLLASKSYRLLSVALYTTSYFWFVVRNTHDLDIRYMSTSMNLP